MATRYSAANIASPWRGLAVTPGDSAATQRAAALYLYSGLAVVPGTTFAAELFTADALCAPATFSGGAALAAEVSQASGAASPATFSASTAFAAEVWSASAAAQPATLLFGAVVPLTDTRIRPGVVAQGPRETLPWRFDLAAVLNAGETVGLPTVELRNLTTEAAYPAGLLGGPVATGIYLTQWVTALEAGMTYRLWIGFTILPTGTRGWQLQLDIQVPALRR